MASKRYKQLSEKIDNTKKYSVEEAAAFMQELKSANFDETVEIAMNLNVDPRHADQMVRGAIVLPHGTGKVVRVAVFAKGAKADEAKAAGADIVGTDDLVEQIQEGNINFDVVVAAPDCMGLVGKIGRILGPTLKRVQLHQTLRQQSTMLKAVKLRSVLTKKVTSTLVSVK